MAYAAALWATVFAVFHVIWAPLVYPLLNAEQARLAFATPWKWAYCVVVAVLCLIAVPVALAPVTAFVGPASVAPPGLRAGVRWIDAAVLWAGAGLVQSGLSRDDRPVHGHGDLGTMVLPGRRSVHPEHVALETRPVARWIPAWTR